MLAILTIAVVGYATIGIVVAVIDKHIRGFGTSVDPDLYDDFASLVEDGKHQTLITGFLWPLVTAYYVALVGAIVFVNIFNLLSKLLKIALNK
jgi:hypothetical protein